MAIVFYFLSKREMRFKNQAIAAEIAKLMEFLASKGFPSPFKVVYED